MSLDGLNGPPQSSSEPTYMSQRGSTGSIPAIKRTINTKKKSVEFEDMADQLFATQTRRQRGDMGSRSSSGFIQPLLGLYKKHSSRSALLSKSNSWGSRSSMASDTPRNKESKRMSLFSNPEAPVSVFDVLGTLANKKVAVQKDLPSDLWPEERKEHRRSKGSFTFARRFSKVQNHTTRSGLIVDQAVAQLDNVTDKPRASNAASERGFEALPEVENVSNKSGSDSSRSSKRCVRISMTEVDAPPAILYEPTELKAVRKSALKKPHNEAMYTFQEVAQLRLQEEFKVLQTVKQYLGRSVRVIKLSHKGGAPSVRYMTVRDDGQELHWGKVPFKSARLKIQQTRSLDRRFKLPTIFKGTKSKIANSTKSRRCRDIARIRGIFYGPYSNPAAFRGMSRDIRPEHSHPLLNTSVGKDWLCITICLDGRTLDVVFDHESTVTSWFLGLQYLAPLNSNYLTRGKLLWCRLIMKLNHYGLDPHAWPGPPQDAEASAPLTVPQIAFADGMFSELRHSAPPDLRATRLASVPT